MKNINEMTLDELAEYAMTLPDWEWMPGMLTTADVRITCADSVGGVYSDGGEWFQFEFDILGGSRPDLTDSATVGCVMAMVRKKHGNHAFVRYSVTFDEWCVGTSTDIFIYGMPTEAHALIAALAKDQ